MKISACIQGLFALAFGVMVVSAASAQDTIYDLPWIVGPGEVDIPHIPATLVLSDTEAVVTGNDALDFERLGTGGFSFRAPAVLVGLNAERHIVDNVYIQYSRTGHIADNDWEDRTKPQVLAQLFSQSQARANAARQEASRLYFDRWLQVPVFDPATLRLEYAFGLKQGSGAAWVNMKVLALTREGYLAITWIGTEEQYESAASRIRAIADNLQVDAGEAYADFRVGDLRANIGVGELIATTLSGKTVDQIRVQNFMPDLTGIATKMGLALIILGLIGFFRLVQKGGLRWQYLASAGVLLAVASFWALAEFREIWHLPTQDEVENAEGVVKEARVTGTHLTLELMGLEGIVSFDADMSDKANEVFQSAKASYDTGMRIKIGYVSAIGDGGFYLAELCRSEDECALTFAESHALAVQRQGHWHGAIVAALILAAALVVWAFVLRMKAPRTDNERAALDGVLASLLGVLAVFVICRVGYLELLRWSGAQVAEVGRVYNDVGFRETIVQADRALRWGILDEEESHELRRLKADAMQSLAVEEANDAMQMEALGIFEELLADDPESSEYLKAIGYSFIYLGAYPEATAIGHRLVAVGNSYWGNIRLALVHRINGEHGEAKAYYQKARDDQGDWYGMPLNYHRAKNHVLAGEHEAAISAINKGIEYQDNYAWSYAYRACAKASLDDMTGALEDYRKALEIMRANRAESTTPDKIFPSEQEMADLVEAFESGAPAVPDSGNYCSQHTADGETRRDRSPLLPAAYRPEYLVVQETEAAAEP